MRFRDLHNTPAAYHMHRYDKHAEPAGVFRMLSHSCLQPGLGGHLFSTGVHK